VTGQFAGSEYCGRLQDILSTSFVSLAGDSVQLGLWRFPRTLGSPWLQSYGNTVTVVDNSTGPSLPLPFHFDAAAVHSPWV